MKAGWQLSTLGKLCRIRTGKKDVNQGNPEGEFPFFTCAANHTFSDSYSFDTEALLIAGNGDVGSVSYYNGKFEAYQRTYVLSDFSEVLPRFLYLILDGKLKETVSKQKLGNTMPYIKVGMLTDFELPVPPLPEQQRIVTLLDEAFDGIATAKAHAEKNLQNARAIFESHLQSVFTQRGDGWVICRLKSLTTKIGSGATPRGGEESYKAQGVSLIRSLNVHDLGFKYSKLAFLDDAQAGELSNVKVQSRDVLLNITGASVARCTIVPEDVLPARVNQHVSIIRPIVDKLDADFLHYLLISKPYKDQLLKTGEEGGSTRQAITKAQIQEFSVAYPPTLSEQKVIAAKLDGMLAETQLLESIYQQKLTALDELKKSLLHRAFNGEL
jgi:type I restriction enzyme S subunit